MDFDTTKIVSLILKELPACRAVYFYGSNSSGQATPQSDVDLAVLSDQKFSDEKRFEVAQKIAQVLKKDVDLVDLRQAPTVFQFQVVSSGKRLYSNNEEDSGRFEDFVYKSYAKLNEERSGILKDIQKRGSIF